VQGQSVENVFARAWTLLTSNWIIIVPGLVVGLIVGIVNGVLTPAQPYADPTTTVGEVSRGVAGIIAGIIAATVTIAGFIVTQCYTAGMAGAAWQRGTTTLRDGTTAVNEDAGNVFVAAIGMFVLALIAAALAPFTLFLSIFAFYLFTLYVIPSAVVGNHRGFAAIRESFALVRARFGPTLIIAVVLAVIQFVLGLIGAAFSFAPLLGPIISGVIDQTVIAYVTLVVVGEYLILRGSTAVPGDPVL
jgi:hypothetical protein